MRKSRNEGSSEVCDYNSMSKLIVQVIEHHLCTVKVITGVCVCVFTTLCTSFSATAHLQICFNGYFTQKFNFAVYSLRTYSGHPRFDFLFFFSKTVKEIFRETSLQVADFPICLRLWIAGNNVNNARFLADADCFTSQNLYHQEEY